MRRDPPLFPPAGACPADFPDATGTRNQRTGIWMLRKMILQFCILIITHRIKNSRGKQSGFNKNHANIIHHWRICVNGVCGVFELFARTLRLCGSALNHIPTWRLRMKAFHRRDWLRRHHASRRGLCGPERADGRGGQTRRARRRQDGSSPRQAPEYPPCG